MMLRHPKIHNLRKLSVYEFYKEILYSVARTLFSKSVSIDRTSEDTTPLSKSSEGCCVISAFLTCGTFINKLKFR